MADENLFKHQVPIYRASRIVRYPSAHDVRLTPSDKIHNMIMQAAEDEYQRLKRLATDKKTLQRVQSEKKEGSVEFAQVASVPAALFQKTESEDKLPKLGIPALDRSLESVKSTSEVGKRPSAQTMLSITHIDTTAPLTPDEEEAVEEPPSFLLPIMPVSATAPKKVTKPQVRAKKLLAKAKPTPKKIKKTKVAPAVSPRKPTPARPTKPTKPIKSKKGVKVAKVTSKTKAESAIADKRESIAVGSRGPSVVYEVFGPVPPDEEIIDIFEDRRVRESNLNTTWIEEMKKKLRQQAATDETTSPDKLSTPRQEPPYHPYAHRKMKNGLSNCGALAMIIKSLLASNALKMPEVVECIGHYNAVIPQILVLIWVSVAFHIYLCCRQSICKALKVPYLPYGDTMGEALWMGPAPMKKMSRWFPLCIDTIVVYHQLIVLTKYSIFFCHYAVLTFDSDKKGLHYSMYAIPFMLLAVVVLYIRSMTKFVYFAFFGDIIACIHYSIFLSYMIGSPPEEDDAGDFQIRPFVPHVLFIGHILSVTDIIVTVLVVEENMKHPRLLKGYSGLLNMALIFSCLWYIVISFFSVRQFGGSKHGKYLAHLKMNEQTCVSLFLIYALVLAGAYGVQSFYPMKLMWLACLDTKIRDSEKRLGWEYLLRTSYATLPFMIMFFPKPVLYVIMFAGYLSGPFLTFCCPAFGHFCVNWGNRLTLAGRLKLLADIFLLLFSFCGIASVAFWYVNTFSIL